MRQCDIKAFSIKAPSRISESWSGKGFFAHFLTRFWTPFFAHFARNSALNRPIFGPIFVPNWVILGTPGQPRAHARARARGDKTGFVLEMHQRRLETESGV